MHNNSFSSPEALDRHAPNCRPAHFWEAFTRKSVAGHRSDEPSWWVRDQPQVIDEAFNVCNGYMVLTYLYDWEKTLATQRQKYVDLRLRSL